MSLVLTCDGCGAGISPEELARGSALEHEGAHYCGRCKGPVLAVLRKARGKELPAAGRRPGQTTGAPPARPSSSGRPGSSGKARPSGGASVPDADPLDLIQGLEPLAAGPPAGPAGGPAALDSELEGSGDLDADLEALGRQPAPGARAQGSVPHRGGPPAPRARPPLHGSAPPPIPRPTPRALPRGGAPAPSMMSPVKHPGKPPPRPSPGIEGASPGRGGFRPGKKKVLIIGGTVAGAAVVGLLLTAFFVRSRSPSSREKAVEAARGPAAEETGQARIRAMVEEERRKIESLRSRLSGNPEEALALRRDLEFHVPPQELLAEHRQALAEVEQKIAELAEKTFQETRKRSEEYQKEDKFAAAGELWKDMPEIVRRGDLRARWVEEEARAQRYAAAWARWTRIDLKADKYLGQDDPDIAVAILECEDNYPPNCAKNFPLIWARRQERVNGLRVNSESERLLRSERTRERRKADEEADRIRQEREREAAWSRALAATEWMSLISREGGDLENWTHRSAISSGAFTGSPDDVKIPWTIRLAGGEPILAGDSSGHDGEIEIGINGNGWNDWVLEFDVEVEAGILRLRTRTFLGRGGQGRTICSTEVKRAAPRDFEFPAAGYRTWKRVRVEARGKRVLWLEDGVVRGQVDTPESRRGGFIFALDARGVARLRKVELKVLFRDTGKTAEDEEGDVEDQEEPSGANLTGPSTASPPHLSY